MTIAAVRTAIATTLSGIVDIGVVHEYQRYAKRLDDFKDFYFSAAHDNVRGWHIKRRRFSESSAYEGRGVEITDWGITGYVGIQDGAASEITVDELIEDARAAFAAAPTLGGAVHMITLPTGNQEHGLQLESIDEVMFCQVLCHRIQLQLFTVRYL